MGVPLTSSLATPASAPALTDAQRLYLDLLKKCLTRTVLGAEDWQLFEPRRGTLERVLWAPVAWLLRRGGLRLARPLALRPPPGEVGRDWPGQGETVVGLGRLENLETVVAGRGRRGVPGDLGETGVWRGGAAIFKRGVLKALEDTERKVWACDSFAGLPRSDPERYKA